jgi:hypothetical protein
VLATETLYSLLLSSIGATLKHVERNFSWRRLTCLFFPPPCVPYGLRSLPSRLWPKCNRLLSLGRPWGAVTLSRWGGWWYMDMKYQEGP